MNFPLYTGTLLAITIGLFLSSNFICNQDLPEEDQNPIQFIINTLAFNGCDDLPSFVGWGFFFILTIGWSFVLWAFIAPLFNNVLTGAIAGIALIVGALTIAINYFFG